MKGLFEEDYFDQYCLSNRTLDGLITFQGVPENDLFTLKALINLQKRTSYYHYKIFKTEVGYFGPKTNHNIHELLKGI
jgi:hypothetical protein